MSKTDLKRERQLALLALAFFLIAFFVFREYLYPALNVPALAATSERGYAATSVIEINAASMKELMIIPGIGEALAGRIIEKRDELGGFASLQDVLLVHGIGEKKLEKMKPYIIIEKNRKVNVN
ncbi:MAG: helix-hairpin-helix domain-containing protein [Deltaproteobacteria bacterium]|nr:helix-hairpin-helix domain-containing protein [Deltaproteobacteria bacterium]